MLLACIIVAFTPSQPHRPTVCNKLQFSTQNNEPFGFGKLHFSLRTIFLMDTIKACWLLRELAFTT